MLTTTLAAALMSQGAPQASPPAAPAAPTGATSPASPPREGGAGGPPPPAGRPPEGCLLRSNPKCYEVTWEVLLQVVPRNKDQPSPIQLEDSNFFFPVVPLSTFSRVELDSLRMTLDRTNQPDARAAAAMRLDRTAPGGVAVAVLPIGPASGQTLRASMTFTSVAWRSDIDDAAAARVPWPSEWAPEAKAWLGPQFLIESHDPRFAAFVERTAGNQLRYTPVFVAAKQLLRATIAAFRGVDGNGVEIGRHNQVRGLRMVGAAGSMEAAQGTAADLVCACVAVLRAAGIPARPVIGVDEEQAGGNRAVRTTFVVWGEFFLPGSGWVPFDPLIMRGSNNSGTAPDRPWSGLGRLKELNTRVPLSYYFLPPRNDASLIEFPAAWGWSARGVVANGVAFDSVRFQMVSRPLPPDLR